MFMVYNVTGEDLKKKLNKKSQLFGIFKSRKIHINISL